MKDKRIYDSTEASQLSGVAVGKLAAWAREGKIPSDKQRGRWRFSFNDVARAIVLHARETGEKMTLTEARRWLAGGGWAARGLGGPANISCDPRVLSGVPCAKGTRVPAEQIARYAEDPPSFQSLASPDGYGLDFLQIYDAYRWWKAASAYPEEGYGRRGG